MTPTKLLVGQTLIVFAIMLAGVWSATQADMSPRLSGWFRGFVTPSIGDLLLFERVRDHRGESFLSLRAHDCIPGFQVTSHPLGSPFDDMEDDVGKVAGHVRPMRRSITLRNSRDSPVDQTALLHLRGPEDAVGPKRPRGGPQAAP